MPAGDASTTSVCAGVPGTVPPVAPQSVANAVGALAKMMSPLDASAAPANVAAIRRILPPQSMATRCGHPVGRFDNGAPDTRPPGRLPGENARGPRASARGPQRFVQLGTAVSW